MWPKMVSVCALALFFLVVNTAGLPRDSSVVKVEQEIQAHENVVAKDSKVETLHPEINTNEFHFPGRVFCEFEEATEDPVCQEHCFPKGYKYGLCTNNVCSCV